MSLLYRKGKAQNMPVVGGCLIINVHVWNKYDNILSKFLQLIRYHTAGGLTENIRNLSTFR